MNREALIRTAEEIFVPGKGVIAADESAPTCQARFDAVGLPYTEENRRAYRELLFTADGLEQYISAVILYDETIRQRSTSGVPFAKVLAEKGIVPGIKVDLGAKELALHPGEKITEGLDGLRERFVEYKAMGARFAKWRAVVAIGPNIPSPACLRANAHALARYSALCQEVDIVPILEPEVLMDGDHEIERSFEATTLLLKEVFKELADQGVLIDGAVLKTNMVIAGKDASSQSSPEEVAEATLKCLRAIVPDTVPGVLFLSGGQGDEQATANLNAIEKRGPFPWPLTFSYSRAIQNPVLKIWAQNPSGNVALAQQVLLFRSRMNALAAAGKYSEDMEQQRPY
ncbi:MAG: fructose-bisphosphate aldolase [Candidatus Terrybacteria bacterium RIFCSPLOWO2_01_FULL_58_14]|uniref:Probable fructose-bisphosphate aldolase class 1 n=2 Tax=Candidatus Terryibacteriota TaxID=1817920 RepID=A0A1G2PXC0_9BACT|nr:MAG: fructose-bisphosphate aldolase [Candidatus Terrybacteria bacterium RIFCSPHIGHO2_01_FULL_58_15]OHA52975.1 MAG: fructose-bisphosphate aldolase [Candidatus Terrybacteria bacterium RIFCSPLOWO2_01_FULL_58_14]